MILQLILSGIVSFAAVEPNKNIAFSKEEQLSLRWKAFMEHVRTQGPKSLPDIQRALKSSDWFMRDAGIKALSIVNAGLAKKEAKNILKNDASLIVRTSAVEVLKVLKDKTAGPELWLALNDKKNFRKKQSLWIRPRILTALIELEDRSIPNYRKALQDSDPRIQKIAVFALKKFNK